MTSKQLEKEKAESLFYPIPWSEFKSEDDLCNHAIKTALWYVNEKQPAWACIGGPGLFKCTDIGEYIENKLGIQLLQVAGCELDSNKEPLWSSVFNSVMRSHTSVAYLYGTTLHNIVMNCTMNDLLEIKNEYQKDSKQIDMTGKDFGWAIESLKNGKKVRRSGWNGKGMYLILFDGQKDIASKLGYGFGESLGEFYFSDTIGMKTAQNTMVLGWLASQTDMLAEDWELAE